MEIVEELRARLTQASADDLEATYALYLDGKKLQVNLACRNDLDAVETVRRTERVFAKAIRAAQSRGELMAHGSNMHSTGMKKVSDYLPGAGMSSAFYKLCDGVTDELFEQAIDKCRADGSLGRDALHRQIKELRGAPKPPAPSAPRLAKARHTARGRRTIEHMAIQMDAVARGVEELEPTEVDRKAMYHAINKVYSDMGVIKAFLREVK